MRGFRLPIGAAERSRLARLDGWNQDNHRRFGVVFMRQHYSRAAIIILIVLLAVVVWRPHLDGLLFATTSPRPIATRSDLPEAERATIGLFERVSPSVVQVVGVA